MMKLKILAITAATLLGACTTTFDSNKVDYKSKGTVTAPLEVPPDLALITKNSQASVPVGGAANASAFQTSAAVASVATTNATAVNKLGDVRVVREGTQRWLVTDRPPEKLWEEVKNFWADNGLTVILDQPNLGIM